MMTTTERKEYMKAYNKAHRETIRERSKAYYAANRDRCLESSRAYRKANPERFKKLSREYRRAHQPRISIRKRAKIYDLSLEDMDLLLSTTYCEICGTDTPGGDVSGRSVGWRIDHCHSTGKVRGVLCNRCNMGIGLFEDDTLILKKAIQYLIERNGWEEAMTPKKRAECNYRALRMH